MQTILFSNPPQIEPTEDELRELEHKTKIIVASINKLNVNTKRYFKHPLNAQQLGELLADCNISFSFLCYLLECYSSWQYTLLQNSDWSERGPQNITIDQIRLSAKIQDFVEHLND